MTDVMGNYPFSPLCHKNSHQMFFEMSQYTQSLIQECVALRRRHRQEMLPSITPSTSNMIKKLKTHKKLLLEGPTSYQRDYVSEKKTW